MSGEGKTSEEVNVKKADQREKRLARQRLLDMAVVLSTPQGRGVVWGYIKAAGVYESSFTGNNTTFYNEGRRAMGLMILADVMEAKPSAYLQMAEEAKAREENDNG